MLELGQGKKEKRAVVVGLSVIHVGALGGIVTMFAAGLANGMTLSPLLVVVAVAATTLWLFSFVLLSVNIAYYLFAPRENDEHSEDEAQHVDSGPAR